MRRIHDKKRIEDAIGSDLLGLVFQKLENVCLIEYEEGEYPDSSFSGGMLQVVEEGSVEIYMLRADGTSFSLGAGGRGTMLGDIEVMLGESVNAIAEAKEKTLCLVAPLRGQREILLNDTLFLRTAASDMAGMIRYMMEKSASSRTLRESILAYMDFACPDQTFKGIQADRVPSPRKSPAASAGHEPAHGRRNHGKGRERGLQGEKRACSMTIDQRPRSVGSLASGKGFRVVGAV